MLTSARHQAIDCTYPHDFDYISFTSPAPTITQFNDLLQPFDTYIWLSIVTTIAVLMLLSIAYNYINKSHMKYTLCWTVVEIYLGKSISKRITKYRVSFLWLTWMLMSTILAMSYSGTIYSLIAVPVEHRIETIDQLIRSHSSGQLKILVENGLIFQHILVS